MPKSGSGVLGMPGLVFYVAAVLDYTVGYIVAYFTRVGKDFLKKEK